ncbi:MAG TPA: PIN domain-containing protein [Anaerolineales bacterium]|nr:PIN domain-containing protein [Anaerolineales bacterium]
MKKALLDTDILSEILKAKNAGIVSKAVEYKENFERFTISVITVMEIVKGLHKAGRADALKKFLGGLQAIEIISFDENCSVIAGRMFADLENTGQPIGRADPMIAAIAMQHELTLVTGNTAHYERLQKLGYSLKLDNWR